MMTRRPSMVRCRYCSYFSKNAEYIADTTHPESGEFNGTRSTYLSAVRSTQASPCSVAYR